MQRTLSRDFRVTPRLGLRSLSPLVDSLCIAAARSLTKVSNSA